MNHLLPEKFLKGPPPGRVEKKVIDWSTTPLPEYSKAYAVVLDGLFSAEECNKLVAAAVSHNQSTHGNDWERALINTGDNEQKLVTDIRNSGRVICDDVDVAARMWQRIAPHVPELAKEQLKNNAEVTGAWAVMSGDIWEFSCLNERLRFLRYGPGEYFKWHFDGMYTRPDDSESSFYTLHLYLNEADEQNKLVGGATTFHSKSGSESDFDVVPKVGRILIFQHKGLLHSGQTVTEGLKYTLRTDLMFRRLEETVPKSERPQPRASQRKARGHR